MEDTSTNGECDIGTTNILFDEPISGVTKIEYNTSWNNNQSGASPASNHKLGYNANSNSDAIFYQNGSPTGWYTAYEGAPIDFTGVYFEVVNNGLNSQGCYAIRVNGTVLDLNNRVVLTFPSEKDIKLFQVGDVVQGVPSITASISGYDQTYNDSIGREITMNNGDEYDITSNQTYWWTKEDVGNNSFVFKKVSGQNFQIYGYTAAETNVDGGATRLLNDVTEFTLDASLFASTYEYIRVYATSHWSNAVCV